MAGHLGGIAALRQYAFRRRLLGWRVVPSLGVALLPALLALVYAQVAVQGSGAPTPYRLYGEFLAPMSLYFVLPFVSMLTMLPILSEIYEKGAVGYYFTRPVPRWVALLGLYQGGLLAMLPVLLIGALLPALVLAPIAHGVELRFWAQRVAGSIGVLWLGGGVYGALCLLLGVWSKKAILWAFALLIGWGAIAGSITGPLRATSLHRYLFSLQREWLDVQNAWGGFYVPDPDPPGVAISLAVVAGSTLLFLLLASRVTQRRDVL